MPTIKRYLRWAVLGLIFVLTASVNLFCVVIDNDDDGDPTTGLTIEFTAVQGKRIQVVASPVHLKSTVAFKVFRARFFRKQRVERSNELNTNSSFSSLIDILGPPLRC
jgi:acyl-coenzyme A thioesterase PaaI-like protein